MTLRDRRSPEPCLDDCLEVAGAKYWSRLLVGIGFQNDFEDSRAIVESCGAEIVSPAVKRVNVTDPARPRLVDYVDPNIYTYLPNSAGCHAATDAVKVLREAREAGGWDLVKLEILGRDQPYYPDMQETLSAAETLVDDGFKVMVHCNDDPIASKRLEDLGVSAIMPMGAPIGSGLGLLNPTQISQIVTSVSIPVVLDAGIGTASDACVAMELGCDGLLLTMAISEATDSIKMAKAMKLAVEAGRLAYLSGRMAKINFADQA